MGERCTRSRSPSTFTFLWTCGPAPVTARSRRWKKVLPPERGQHWNLPREPRSGNLRGDPELTVHEIPVCLRELQTRSDDEVVRAFRRTVTGFGVKRVFLGG